MKLEINLGIKRLKSSPVYQNIKTLTFETIPILSNLQDISNLKVKP